jgi:glycosyltransferase involved in cell wall biosynthesis
MLVWFAAAMPADAYGGVNRSMRELASGLVRRGHSALLFFSSGNAGGLPGSPVSGVVLRSRTYFDFSLRLAWTLLRSGPGRPDWIVARSSDGLCCALLSRCGLVRTRIMLHNHGWEEKVFEAERRYPTEVITSRTTWKARLLRFPMLRACLQLSHGCVCGALDEAKWIAGRYPRMRAKIRLVPNGIDESSPCMWEKSEERPMRFLCVAGWTWKKNAEYAVELFRAITGKRPSARLVLVGGDSAEPRVPFAGMEKSVDIIGQLPPGRMNECYCRCPYLISASRYEGGRSLAILEAMSYGAVVFATGIGSTREIIRHERNGMLLCGTDPEADTRIILKVLDDKDFQEKLGRRARLTALRHRWPRQVRRLEAMLCR